MYRTVLAIARRLLHHLTAPWCAEERYAAPEGAAGYRGWIEAPRIGVLAFRTVEGKLTYRW